MHDIETIMSEHKAMMLTKAEVFVRGNNIPFDYANDIYQDACILLFKKLPEYDESKSLMKTFVSNLTNLACFRFRHSYFKTITIPIDESAFLISDNCVDGAREIIDSFDMVDEFEKAILNAKLDGFTQQEIARDYCVSQSKVSRILTKFRNLLIGTVDISE